MGGRQHARRPRRRAGPVHRTWRRLSRLEPLGRWLAGVVAGIVTTALVAWLVVWGLLPDTRSDGPTRTVPTSFAALPFTMAARSTQSPIHGWISDKPMAQVPARPPRSEPWQPWAEQVGAVPATRRLVFLTVQGRSAAQVTLTSLQVRVAARRPAIRGTYYVIFESGDPGIYRWVDVDLDQDPPALTDRVSDLEDAPDSVPPHERRPIRFPYGVSLTDAETFVVEAHTGSCHCDWTIELAWAAEGRTGTAVIDDNGRPFQLSGLANATMHCYTLSDAEQCSPR